MKKRSVLSLSICALTVGGTIAVAQDNSNVIDEIVITGSFRGSLAEALDNKREIVGSIDQILAEDIGKFPASNLAESLQRLPGIAITRDAGEGRQISVRGLGPDFTRVRINGMEALSTTGATDSSGGANRGRAFDFNTFASELFRSLTVKKTASADLEEGSLGATIDLQTTRPFDLADDFTFVSSGQLSYNDASSESDPRFAVLVGGKNADETFGWTASLAYSSRDSIEEGFSAVRWQDGTQFESCPGCDTTEAAAINIGGSSSVFHPRIPRYGLLTHEQDRLGLTGGLQWRPSDKTLVSFDILQSQLESTRSEEFLEAVSFSRNNGAGNRSTDIIDVELAGNDIIYGVFNDVDVRVENRFDELETDFNQYTLNVEHEFSDTFSGAFFYGTTESNFKNPVQTTIIFDAFDVDGYTYDFRGNRELPLINYGNLDVLDPTAFLFTEVRDRPNKVDNSFDRIAVDFGLELNDIFSLSFGASLNQYEFDVREARRDTTVDNIPGFSAPIPVTAALSNITSFDNGLGVPGGTNTRFVTPNIGAAAAMVDLYNLPAADRTQDIRFVEEDDMGIYVQLNWNSEIASLPFRGNIGVRNVETDQSSRGIQSVGGVSTPVTVSRDYTETLPSLNTVLEINDSLLLRFSYAEVITRPSLSDLTPGGSVDGFNNIVSYSNPLLDPFRADAFDLALEWYFAGESLLSIAYFHKDIESFIVSRTDEDVPWSSLGLPDSLLDNVPATPSDTFDVNRRVNGTGGDLDGFEIIWQQPITETIGVITSYTSVDSEVNYAGPGDPPNINDLLGLSDTSYSLTAYYEDERFSGRISYSARDDYLTRVPGRNGNDLEGTEGTKNWDAKFTYNLNDNLEFNIEGINLTDEENHQTVDSSSRTTVFHHTGRQYYIGMQYKY